ncbi:MAG: helix-turn-helix transcriptional regulator [Paracoccaceae bacterium]
MRPSIDELRGAPDLRVLDGVASWCGGLHGAMPLGEALKALASGIGASSAAIARHHYRSEERPRLVALYPGASTTPLTRPYVDEVLGPLFQQARAGSVWFLSDLYDDPVWSMSHTLASLLRDGSTRDVVAIPMSANRQSVDYIEFHFEKPLSRAEQKEIEALVPTIERSWLGRKPGLVATSTLEGRALPAARYSNENERPRWDRPILGMTNPAGLSRAEFRVCLLVSRGLSVKAVSDELGLSDNTVRSHLRAIYAKTETSSLSELIYLILSVTEEPDVPAVTAHRA